MKERGSEFPSKHSPRYSGILGGALGEQGATFSCVKGVPDEEFGPRTGSLDFYRQ